MTRPTCRRHRPEDERDRRHRANTTTHAAALGEWARLNDLTERENGRGWCGHHLLGKRPRREHNCPRPHGLGSRFWDHTRGFGRGRTPVAILGFPYGNRDTITFDVSAYAAIVGLNAYVGDSRGHMSAYFWGNTTPWILTAPSHNARALFHVDSPELQRLLTESRDYGIWRNGETA